MVNVAEGTNGSDLAGGAGRGPSSFSLLGSLVAPLRRPDIYLGLLARSAPCGPLMARVALPETGGEKVSPGGSTSTGTRVNCRSTATKLAAKDLECGRLPLRSRYPKPSGQTRARRAIPRLNLLGPGKPWLKAKHMPPAYELVFGDTLPKTRSEISGDSAH